jgi:hypothetical protein
MASAVVIVSAVADNLLGTTESWSPPAFETTEVCAAYLGANDTITESTLGVPSGSGLTTHSPSISTDGKVTAVWLKSGNAGGVYSATKAVNFRLAHGTLRVNSKR